MDSASDLQVAANKLLNEENRRVSPFEQTIRMIGDGAKIVERAFAATGYTVKEEQLDEFVKRYLAFYEPNAANLTVLFQVLNALNDSDFESYKNGCLH